jgi:hypothetical protein
MNDYMRDNKVEAVTPQGLTLPTAAPAEAPPAAEPVKPAAPKGKPKHTDS